MKPIDRNRLTSALRDHVAKIAVDLRAKMRAPGAVRERARQLHADEQVAEDFDVWTDLLSRRASVLWVLKSVYVRVLEDRGLLNPGRLLDPEAQQLFEALAPHLGETAFLRWMYRDLASADGGLPELFSPQPAEVALPSDELSRGLIAFWRHRDADSGAHWSFAEERFEGELMGDLYQELDPVVKDRFALCQTPDFVRAFILDRTLTPAIETFGADQVRLLDPACGSGHFLIDGLKRLVAATASQHPEWTRAKVALHTLDRVVGVDLNDYACGLARARLVMTAAELADVNTLADAARFHPHVYWADGLEQVEKGRDTRGRQLDLLDPARNEAPRAGLTRPEVRAALQTVLQPRFHAVVGNPPYIPERDAAAKKYHKDLISGRARYVSAKGKYSLAAPFIERCIQLAVPNGFAGLIVANNFLKRNFGKALIEQVLSATQLRLVVDTSQAHIPNHGTPTVILVLSNRPPSAERVRVVAGRRGEDDVPENAADGAVWRSIIDHWQEDGFENEYVSVSSMPHKAMATHPWSLEGRVSQTLKTKIEAAAKHTLRSIAREIGYPVVIGEDEAFAPPTRANPLWQLTESFVTGADVRDWSCATPDRILCPYVAVGAETLRPLERGGVLERRLLPLRRRLQKAYSNRPAAEWYSYVNYSPAKLQAKAKLTFAFVSTHNQFALAPNAALHNRHAPLVVLASEDSEEMYSALGSLNSSTLGFWMRQVFHAKGGESTGKKRQSEPWSRRLEYDSTKMQNAPLPRGEHARIADIAAQLTRLAAEAARRTPRAVLRSAWEPPTLSRELDDADKELALLRKRMVALQEELDWTTYAAFGLAPSEQLAPLETIEPLASEHRPFAIRLARAAAAGEATGYWFEAMEVDPAVTVPDQYAASTRARIEERLSLLDSDDALSLLESPEYKRKWEPRRFKMELEIAALEYLADHVELKLKERSRPTGLSQLAASVQDDPRFLAVAGIYQQRRDVDVVGLVTEIVASDAVPNHYFHVFTDSGIAKREAWEKVWELQRREDAGEKIDDIPIPPEYSQGSRGKSTDFVRDDYWHLRGKLDVQKERFIAFTEVPARVRPETLYGWAGWTALQRLKATLAIDEELEDAGVTLADRIGLLDGAWRLLPDVAREDGATATRLKAELSALVGPEGPSRELVGDWRRRCPPSLSNRAARTRERKRTPADADAAVDDEDA